MRVLGKFVIAAWPGLVMLGALAVAVVYHAGWL